MLPAFDWLVAVNVARRHARRRREEAVLVSAANYCRQIVVRRAIVFLPPTILAEDAARMWQYTSRLAGHFRRQSLTIYRSIMADKT
jgi:hypothetical protein